MVNLHPMFAFLISFFMTHTRNGSPPENSDLTTPLAVFSLFSLQKQTPLEVEDGRVHEMSPIVAKIHGESLMTLL